MFKYTFGLKKTLLESLRSQKRPLKARFRQNLFLGLSFARGELLGFFGDPNEYLRLIIIYYMFKYTFGNKTTLLESHRS